MLGSIALLMLKQLSYHNAKRHAVGSQKLKAYKPSHRSAAGLPVPARPSILVSHAAGSPPPEPSIPARSRSALAACRPCLPPILRPFVRPSTKATHVATHPHNLIIICRLLLYAHLDGNTAVRLIT